MIQISTNPSASLQGSPLALQTAPSRDKALPARAEQPADAAATPETTTPNTLETVVTVSAASPATADTQASAIFAEVWKEGRKIAAVDMHGGVVTYDGSIASSGGHVRSTPEQAARRAAQIALATGGEIRRGGLVTDQRTLVTQARLARAYAL